MSIMTVCSFALVGLDAVPDEAQITVKRLENGEIPIRGKTDYTSVLLVLPELNRWGRA
jgi:hypothetical protein